jgi:hypothetical protein
MRPQRHAQCRLTQVIHRQIPAPRSRNPVSNRGNLSDVPGLVSAWRTASTGASVTAGRGHAAISRLGSPDLARTCRRHATSNAASPTG